MRGFVKMSVVILSLALTTNSFALDRIHPNKDAAGEVVSVSGIALLRASKDKGNPATGLKLAAGNVLYQDDIINTSSDGAVKILLKDKTIVDLGPSSLFRVAVFSANHGDDRNVELDMKFGRMRLGVSKPLREPGSFKVRTKAATMGVRGTDFIVSQPLDESGISAKSPAQNTQVTVIQGSVDAGGTRLNAGEQFSIQGNTAVGSTVKLGATQLATVASEGKLPDRTFANSVTLNHSVESNGASQSTSNAQNNGRNPANSGASASAALPAGSSLIQNTIAAATSTLPTVSIPFSEIGVPGAPSVANSVTPTLQRSQSFHVTVTVSR